MVLTLEQLREIAHGALRVYEENGEIVFGRFTKEAELYYKGDREDFHRKSFATSGVRLEFMTDSSSVAFAYHTLYASSRRFYYFDVMVDGVLVDHFGHDRIAEARAEYKLALDEGTHTVCIYFPNLADARIKDFTLDDGAMIAPVARPVKLLCYGDSITQGYDAVYASQSYANLLADKLHADMIDQGIGGEHFCPALLDCKIPFTPDIITVAYGTNDWSSQDRDETIEKANAFYAKLRALHPNAKIFAITPIWRKDHTRITKVGMFESIRQIVRNAAEQSGAIVVDGDRVIPHITEVFADGYLHPNDMGFKFYANALYDAMLPYVKED